MNEIIKKVYEQNIMRYESAPNPLRSHGPDHHYRVYESALKLALELNVEYDENVLSAASLLHDMAAYYPDKVGEAYHDQDSKIAEEVLIEVGFPERKINSVLYAIANHGSDPKYKEDNEPVEVSILRDADKIDVFGVVGVARIIMVRTLKGDSLNDIIEDFLIKGHLERKWCSITYDATRNIVRDDYEYSKKFFTELDAKINSKTVA